MNAPQKNRCRVGICKSNHVDKSAEHWKSVYGNHIHIEYWNDQKGKADELSKASRYSYKDAKNKEKELAGKGHCEYGEGIATADNDHDWVVYGFTF